MIKVQYFGIIIPLILFAFFMVVAVFSIGMSVKTDSVSTAAFDSLFPTKEIVGDCPYNVNYYVRNESNKITVQTIRVKNDFFIPRIYKLPKYKICGYPNPNSPSYFSYFGEYISDYIAEFLIDGTTMPRRSTSVYIPPNSERVIEVRIAPQCRMSEVNGTYVYVEPPAFEEILIIERKNKHHGLCPISENDESYRDAIKIKLTE